MHANETFALTSLSIALLQLGGDGVLDLMDELVDITVDEEMRGFDLLLLPLAADVDAKQLVVLLKDLAEASVVEILVILKKNQ